MMRKLLIALNLLLVLAILGVAFYWQPASAPSAPPTAPAVPMGGDFALDGPRGRVSLQDYRGKLVLLYFGYTYCPDVCPTSLLIWAQALKELTPQELARVQPIFVSVDPERDTLPRLAEYAAFFHPSLLPLTGSPERLHEIAARYGAHFARQENAAAGGYVVDHTSSTLLIDRDGRLVARLAHATPPEQLLAEIRQHLPPN